MARLVPIAHHVHVGREGWLFLVGGRNRPLGIYRRSFARSWTLYRWARLLRSRSRRLRSAGIRYLHLCAPEKLSVYPEMTDGLGIDPQLSLARGIGLALDPDGICVDALSGLVAAKADTQTYLRTDSHWTVAGCRLAHDALCRAAGAPLRWRLDDRPPDPVEVVGDLGEKLRPPQGEVQQRRTVTWDARRIWANPLFLHCEREDMLPRLHRGAQLVFRNDAADADPRRVVLFGDSFSHFVPYGLTAMLAETFREVHFCWSAAIDWRYVETVRPDLVITEIAERFMAWLPSDGVDLDGFAADRLRALQQGGPDALRP